MSFGSFAFLFRFLPAAVLLYYICPAKAKNALLAVLSLLFYAWGDVSALAVLLAVAAAGWLAALGTARFTGAARTACYLAGLLGVLGALVLFKYADFTVQNLNALGLSLPLPRLTAPVGISFYAFSVAGYVIDVRRGACPPCKSPLDFLLYTALFPKLLMGPIALYKDFAPQLADHPLTAEKLERGAVRFITGLAKKVLLADSASALWSEVSAIGFANASTGLCWLGVLAYAFQLYFDFSGYSDMAVGLGLFFGFELPENFLWPYSSGSATEFWRRWHITMGVWFKQYVYFPLGGSRCSKARSFFNMFAVWALTGLWHGAAWNYVLWGLYYFVLLVIEKSGLLGFLEKHRLLARLYMIPVTCVGWALFAVPQLPLLWQLLGRMFVPTALTGGAAAGALYYLRCYGVLLALCALLCTEKAGALWKKLCEKPLPRVLLLTALLLLLSVAYLTGATYKPFLYTQF